MTQRHPFDTLAPHYRWMESISFGPLLHWCRTVHLPKLAKCQRALVIGDGNGRFLAELLSTHPTIQADAIDISPKMTDLARHKTAFAGDRVRFTVGDIRQVPLPPAGYDLIVTNFLLDCFEAEPLAEVVERLASAATTEALWLVGDFAVPRGRWRAGAARIALAAMYAFFRLFARLEASKLTDPSPLFSQHGFTPLAEAERLGGFLSSRLWQRKDQTPRS